jgi:hypothetical protein
MSFNEFAETLTYKSIDSLPWILPEDGISIFDEPELPLGLVLKIQKEDNIEYMLVGSTLVDRTRGCGCCSEDYFEYDDDANRIPFLPIKNVVGWAMVFGD